MVQIKNSEHGIAEFKRTVLLAMSVTPLINATRLTILGECINCKEFSDSKTPFTLYINTHYIFIYRIKYIIACET